MKSVEFGLISVWCVVDVEGTVRGEVFVGGGVGVSEFMYMYAYSSLPNNYHNFI